MHKTGPMLKSLLLALLLWVILLSSLLLCTGCTDQNNSPEIDTVVVDFDQVLPETGQHTGQENRDQLRIAVGAMISPRETYRQYRELFAYVSRLLDRELAFVQRKTYAQINELFRKGRLDLAFICSGPYALGQESSGFDLLVAPQVNGDHVYYSYLIVNADSPFQSLQDLEEKTFAFTDPHSNSGRIVPLYWLHQMGTRPEEFFDQTIYTYSHDNSILAVARGLVDGAAVDSLIWEFMHQAGSEIVQQTRVIRKSQPFGIPPIVVSSNMSDELRQKVQDLLLNMHLSEPGASFLSELDIDKFIPADDSWYDPIRTIHAELQD
ncbi:MAG: phosphate/phosphite/phosphonate ABC transporter substrate-binding protein [Desulfovermiculus sp.]|nr:phosphate/phosphite/phosphonate ABC transporter substrate-binding protein [Desulfovermiculus sp.]